MGFWITLILIVAGLWIAVEVMGRFFPDSVKGVIYDFFRFIFKGE